MTERNFLPSATARGLTQKGGLVRSVIQWLHNNRDALMQTNGFSNYNVVDTAQRVSDNRFQSSTARTQGRLKYHSKKRAAL